MSASPKDPDAVDPKPDSNPEAAPVQPAAARVAGKALPYLAALAAAGAAQAATPPAPHDRAYLEALMNGSWTEPADLSERRLPAETDPRQVAAGLDQLNAVEQGFNDSFNPNPPPYRDKNYSDTGFGDRSR
jgi:hypothetical protein